MEINEIKIVDCDWKPEEGFVVVCDEANNPPSAIDNLIFDIYYV